MAYAILRVAKLKTMGNVGGHGSHVERQRETLNADPQKLQLNQRLAGSDDPVYDVKVRFDEAGIEPRKGAVVAIDVFISASPEHFGANHPDDPNWKAFQAKAMDFLAQEYGAANVVHAIAHHDETSPHIHAIVTPIRSKTIKVGRSVKTERTENRLCAKDWLGGDRKTLSKLQTRFANHVKELGLNRGIEGSKAKHTEVGQFYSIMKETTAQGQAIQQALPGIDVDYLVRSVEKPSVSDRVFQHDYAKFQVNQALSKLSQQIQQANQTVRHVRSGQLVGLQTPVTTALLEKGQTRQSQAEAALAQLGYRLDVHGQLINLLEERKNALRATIDKQLPNYTTLDELRADLANKGIKMSFSKEHQETAGKKVYNGVGFDDSQGRIWGHELGPAYTTVQLMNRLAEEQANRERVKREKQYQGTLDRWLVKHFKDCKGSCSKVATRLSELSGEKRDTFLVKFSELHGADGAIYADRELTRLSKLSALQLNLEQRRLDRAGYDVAMGNGLGYSI